MIRLLYSYNSLRVTDCRCGSAELSCRTDWFVYVAGFYSQLASRVIHTGSVQSGCLPRAPRGVILNTSCHHTFYAYVITKLHQLFVVVTVQAVAIVEQSRFAHTWIKRMKGDIRQREGPKMQAQLVDCFVKGNVWGG